VPTLLCSSSRRLRKQQNVDSGSVSDAQVCWHPPQLCEVEVCWQLLLRRHLPGGGRAADAAAAVLYQAAQQGK
jgi:hypothetical protein